ncbi:MAG: release factor glutamine methyltransferase [Thermoleophilaceae bacterium]|nr:release factor glutamine methyltransferase [Thermoleophilaceae bacterium]
MATAVRSVRDAIAAARVELEAAGCDSARLDAELLLADALDTDRARLHSHPEADVPAAAEERIGRHVARRAAREPVAYIIGWRGFRRIELKVDRNVLIPRPETELLVEVALELPRGASVHEVGTGSGAVALALADERPDLLVTASDSSTAAVAVARANAERLGLEIGLSVARGLPAEAAGADLVVANLPYVAEAEMAGLAPEILDYEPRDALVSGPDGLDAIRDLVHQAPAGCRLALEHAPHQGARVRSLLREPLTLRDLAEHERVTVGIAP